MQNGRINTMTDLIVIGGGLAGSEAAWQAAQQGLKVKLYEMRPSLQTGAHQTHDLAELVCSNSLGSNLPDRASGLLKDEARMFGSMLLECAEETAVPAGGALAVDRDLFARKVTERIESHANIEIVREEVKEIPDSLAIIASGPLTSPALSKSITELSSEEHLFFFDAIAPVIHAESINMEIAFRASRYGSNEQDVGDYINCPFTREEYYAFVEALIHAERIELRSFEDAIKSGVKAGHFFEGCLPIEIIAERGLDSLAYGPMRPVGLWGPRTGKRPHAVVQLRQDNLAGSLYNLVGFQTNLKFPEAKTCFAYDTRARKRRIPSLWTDAPQYIYCITQTPFANTAIESTQRPFICGPDHRSGRIYGQHRYRAACGYQRSTVAS